MPARRKKEKIAGQYFTWLLGRRNGVYFADGRSNEIDLGRNSLGTRDRTEALKLLARLDSVKAVEAGKAPAAVLQHSDESLLPLDEGVRLYLEHVRRPPVLGGASKSTFKRYRAVVQKFVPFAQDQGVHYWQAVSKNILEGYGAWLDDDGYEYATEYLELTCLKQAIKWLVAENKLPSSCLIHLPLKKPQGTTTYCYKLEEVQAIISHCFERKNLIWLGRVIMALAYTGLRISELAQLRWSDIDLEKGDLRLRNIGLFAGKAERQTARWTKNRRDRTLPIHPDLLPVLQAIPHCSDGLVFHGPLAGRLKPDTVRNVHIRDVLTPLAERFQTTTGEADGKGFRDGRLHSFRHFFCSLSASRGVPEQFLMSWLGHRDSKMVRHYFHLHEEESHRQMTKLSIASPL